MVITGGPSTGKTAIISSIESKGYLCFHEISREITLNAREDGIEQLFLTDPLLFSKRILEGRLHQFKEATKHTDKVVFLDRGIPDVIAYLDCFQTEYPTEFKTVCEQNRYDSVFLLPPWKEIYTSDNERYENFEEAVKIHHCLENTYRSFGYPVTLVPTGPIDLRVNFILNHINKK